MEKVKKLLCNFEEAVAGVFLLVLLVLTTWNVVKRWVTGASLPWTEEISYLCYAWVVFVGASAGYKRCLHSSIDLMVQLLPEKVRKMAAVLTTVLTLVVIAAVALLSFWLCKEAYTKLTPILHIPYTFVDLSVAVGFVCMCIHGVVKIYQIVRYGNFGETPIYAHIIDLDANELDESSMDGKETER